MKIRRIIITALSLFAALTTGKAVDFNGDGFPDYVLYNPSTRQTVIWYLHNNVYVSGAYGPTIPAGWSLSTEADFNGDGFPDYVLYNPSTRQTVIWYLHNNVYVSGAYGPTLPSGWQLAAVADFNGDGKPDYVLYNPSTRGTAIWYLNNTTHVGGAYGPTLAPGYLLICAADFNSDGKPDYLLYNNATQQSAIWYMNNNVHVSSAYGPTIASGYTLCEVADFNRDGHPDYVLDPGGVTALWFLNNNVHVGSAWGPTIRNGFNLASASSRPCEESISPPGQAFGVDGGSGSFHVSTTGPQCTWATASVSYPDNQWLHVINPGSGQGSSEVTFSAGVSPQAEQRSADIEVAEQRFHVTQAGTGAEEWNGTWLGTNSGSFCFGGCCVDATETVRLNITQTGSAITGNAEVDGVPCIYTGDCSVVDYENDLGSVSGSANGGTASISWSVTSQSGSCQGNTVHETVTLTLVGNVATGTSSSGHSIRLTKQN